MGFFSRRSKMTKRLLATFIANDADIAMDFLRDITASDEHEYDIDETSEDHFSLFFVIHGDEDRDGDYEDAFKRLDAYTDGELRMVGIFKFEKVFSTEEIKM